MRHRPDTGSQGDRHRHGAPWFKIRDFRKANGVVARSSNYVLHGDMSRRVNEVYRSFADDVEIYSIDESFLDFTGLLDPAGEARKMRCTARQATGIPTCVGLGSTRVLAKVANHLAKKRLELDGVWDPSRRSEQDRLPLLVPAADVWRRTSFCRQTGVRRVHSATDLHALAPQIARSLLTVTGERLVRELTAYAVQSSNWSRRLPGHRRHSLPRRVRHHVGGHATGDDLLRYPRRGKAETARGACAAFVCLLPHWEVPGWPQTLGQRSDPDARTDGRHPRAREGAASVTRRLWANGYRYAKAGVILDALLKPKTQLERSSMPRIHAVTP